MFICLRFTILLKRLFTLLFTLVAILLSSDCYAGFNHAPVCGDGESSYRQHCYGNRSVYELTPRTWKKYHNYGADKGAYVDSGIAPQRRGNCLIFGPYLSTRGSAAVDAGYSKKNIRAVLDIEFTHYYKEIRGPFVEERGAIGGTWSMKLGQSPVSRPQVDAVVARVELVGRNKRNPLQIFDSESIRGNRLSLKTQSKKLNNPQVSRCEHPASMFGHRDYQCKRVWTYVNSLTLTKRTRFNVVLNSYKFRDMDAIEVRICDIAAGTNLRWHGTTIQINGF